MHDIGLNNDSQRDWPGPGLTRWLIGLAAAGRACRLAGLLICLFAGDALAAAPTAPAPAASRDPARNEARQLVREGAALFDQEKYAAALDKFQAAFARFPSPKIRFNIAQAHRKLRQPVASTQEFEAFLQGAEQPAAADRQEAESAIREMAAAVARLELAVQPPGASLRVDGLPAGITPLRSALVLSPGEHEIVLELPGYQRVSEAITLRGGQRRRWERSLVAVAPAVIAIPAPATTPTPVSPPPAPPAVAPPASSVAPAAPSLGSGFPPPAVAAVASPPSPAPGGAEPGILAPAPADPARTQRTVGKVLLGSSLAFATGAVVLLAASWSKYNGAMDNGCVPDCASVSNDVDARALWSRVLFGAAAVSGAAGATLVFGPPHLFGPRTPTAAMPASIAVAGKF